MSCSSKLPLGAPHTSLLLQIRSLVVYFLHSSSQDLQERVSVLMYYYNHFVNLWYVVPREIETYWIVLRMGLAPEPKQVNAVMLLQDKNWS